jgi:hypothetical protein
MRVALRNVWADTYVTEATTARLDAAAGTMLARVRADRVESPESVAAEEARRAVFEMGGENWASMLVDPQTPEQRALVERFHEAQARWMDTLPQRPDESA